MRIQRGDSPHTALQRGANLGLMNDNEYEVKKASSRMVPMSDQLLYDNCVAESL